MTTDTVAADPRRRRGGQDRHPPQEQRAGGQAEHDEHDAQIAHVVGSEPLSSAGA